jgi:NAD(P)H-flavin reductase/ferredoxin
MRKFFSSIFASKPKQRVEIRPQGITIEVASGQTILEAALEQGVAYPHNCTVGTCGACKTRLKQGQVKASADFGYTLSKQELEAGYILACQAMPRDEFTVVEIAEPGADMPPPEAYQGQIVATEALTHDILKVTLKVDRPMVYVAGQYASLHAPGMSRARHYSFADAPLRAGRDALTFFIRKVPGGAFTQALFDGQLKDQPLTIEAPHGTFHLRGGNAPMVCVVGGSGLAPLMSILEDARKNRIRRPCTLLFGARTQADLYMLDALKNVAQSWLEPFKFVPVLSHEPADSDWPGARGLVTEHLASAAAGINWTQAEAYMCGPPPMIDAAMAQLTTLGLPLESIHYDKFTDGRDEAPAA